MIKVNKQDFIKKLIKGRATVKAAKIEKMKLVAPAPVAVSDDQIAEEFQNLTRYSSDSFRQS